MMCKRQNLRRFVSLLSVLLFCFGSLAGYCFADTDLPDGTNTKNFNFSITDSNDNNVGNVAVYIDALDSYRSYSNTLAQLNMVPKTLVPYTTSTGSTLYIISSTNYGGSSHSAYTSWTNTNENAVYCTPVSIVVKITNTSDNFIAVGNDIRFDIGLAMNGQSNTVIQDIGYNFNGGDVKSDDLFVRFSNDYIFVMFGNKFRAVNSNNYFLSPHSSNICSFTIDVYHSYWKSGALSTTDIMTVVPYSCVVRSGDLNNRSAVEDVPINNDSYNLQQIENDTETIRSYLAQDQQTQSQISSDIVSEGNQTQSAITSQTQQQEQQYDNFTADSDSSDSSTINSAISSGTDAIKQNVGLFSFFDNIVTGMSNMLSSNHTRDLRLPELELHLPEGDFIIWQEQRYRFEDIDDNFPAVMTVVRFATVAICYIACINGALSIFHKFIGAKEND